MFTIKISTYDSVFYLFINKAVKNFSHILISLFYVQTIKGRSRSAFAVKWTDCFQMNPLRFQHLFTFYRNIHWKQIKMSYLRAGDSESPMDHIYLWLIKKNLKCGRYIDKSPAAWLILNCFIFTLHKEGSMYMTATIFFL